MAVGVLNYSDHGLVALGVKVVVGPLQLVIALPELPDLASFSNKASLYIIPEVSDKSVAITELDDHALGVDWLPLAGHGAAIAAVRPLAPLSTGGVVVVKGYS